MKNDDAGLIEKKLVRSDMCFVVAEVGSNHNKSRETALKMIDLAAVAGVDAVKFQTFKAEDIAADNVLANAYGEMTYTRGKKFWKEVLADIALPYEWHKELFDYARGKGLVPFSTPESPEAVDFLESLNVALYKIASMDITYKDLLVKVAMTGKPIILSSGIAFDDDIDQAIEVLKDNGSSAIFLLYCVSEYPSEYNEINLLKITELKKRFNISIGFSDHCLGNELVPMAVALGAKIVEKHFTLDRGMLGPDHFFALDPGGLVGLVQKVRMAEKALLPSSVLLEKKSKKRKDYGRSIILARDVKAGQKVKLEDVVMKRPGTGISPFMVDMILEKKYKRDLFRNRVLTMSDFE